MKKPTVPETNFSLLEQQGIFSKLQRWHHGKLHHSFSHVAALSFFPQGPAELLTTDHLLPFEVCQSPGGLCSPPAATEEREPNPTIQKGSSPAKWAGISTHHFLQQIVHDGKDIKSTPCTGANRAWVHPLQHWTGSLKPHAHSAMCASWLHLGFQEKNEPD